MNLLRQWLAVLWGMFLWIAVSSQVSANALTDSTLGFSELYIESIESDARPLTGHLWYPAKPVGEVTQAGGNLVWQGFRGIKDAPVAEGKYPFLLLSHGSFGNSFNMSWLAAELAQKGVMVAAINHPGTTTFNRDPLQARQLWQRPKDISRTLSYLTADSTFVPFIDAERIHMAGHSLGGFTAMLLAGARFHKATHDTYCQSLEQPDCKLFSQLNIAQSEQDRVEMEADLSDSRIQSFALFDLGGSQAFNVQSLKNINRDVLIIGSGRDLGVMNINNESRYLDKVMTQSTVRYIELDDASHFDFFGICKAEGIDYLRKNEPDDLMVCDGSGDARKLLHQKIIASVITFFKL